jgi:RNA polymerase sigma-70 factor, ECF subfamily
MTDDIKGDRNAVFVEMLTHHQRKLYGYIYTLIPNASDADDLLQETNIVLWNKHDEYKFGTNFMTWACRIAFLKAQNFLRIKNRSRLYFNDAIVSELSDIRINRTDVHSFHSLLLINCLGKLSAESQKLLKFRYAGNISMQEVAKQLGRPVGSLYNTLSQIRLKLWECIRSGLEEESSL